jgi:hypothetical protein
LDFFENRKISQFYTSKKINIISKAFGKKRTKVFGELVSTGYGSLCTFFFPRQIWVFFARLHVKCTYSGGQFSLVE